MFHYYTIATIPLRLPFTSYRVDEQEQARSCVAGDGLKPWSEPFQVLRRNCETDWAQKYPQYAVSIRIGHDITVSARQYLQVPEELYQKVAEVEPQQAVPGSKQSPQK